MPTRNLTGLLLIASLTAPTASAAPAAQSRRAPTPAEAQVLTRFITAIASTVDRFADGNWEVTGGTFPRDVSHETISVRAGVPLDDCVGGDRTWRVRENSPLFNARLLPLYQRAKSLGETFAAQYRAGKDASSQAKELERINTQIKRIDEVTMDVCGNSPNIEAAALAPGEPSALQGVTAHRLAGELCRDAAACYVLVYGDWKDAKLNASHERYDYHFVHPAASPYLENIVIRLKGADERVQDMLKADWTRVNTALGGPNGQSQ